MSFDIWILTLIFNLPARHSLGAGGDFGFHLIRHPDEDQDLESLDSETPSDGVKQVQNDNFFLLLLPTNVNHEII